MQAKLNKAVKAIHAAAEKKIQNYFPITDSMNITSLHFPVSWFSFHLDSTENLVDLQFESREKYFEESLFVLRKQKLNRILA